MRDRDLKLNLRATAWRSHAMMGTVLNLFRRRPQDSRAHGEETEHLVSYPGGTTYAWEPVVPHEALDMPTFVLQDEAAQELMDSLWLSGFRPSRDAADHRAEGALEATRAHLEDMRRIAMAYANPRVLLDSDGVAWVLTPTLARTRVGELEDEQLEDLTT